LSFGKVEFKSLSDGYKEWLKLDSSPVAFKLLKNLKGFENVPRPTKRLALCQLISQARYMGRTRLGTADDLQFCQLGAAIVGLSQLPEDYSDGQRYVGLHHLNASVGKKCFESVPMFKPGEYAGVLVSPLERCTVPDPEVTIIFGNAAQMLRVVDGYLYNKGGRLQFSSAATAACADAIVTPIQTGKPSVVFPCDGFRIFALPSNSELIAGIPLKQLPEILEGIKFSNKGGAAYPPRWPHIDWEIQPPILDLMRPDLKKK